MTLFEGFEQLLEEIRDTRVTGWSEIEAPFLQAVSEFDSEYAAGRGSKGWYQGKARYFNDVVGMLISNATSIEVASRVKRKSVLFGHIDIDLCYPVQGDPLVAAEVKALGTPPHPGNRTTSRAARSDLHKRVREVALTSMDLKSAYTGPRAILSFRDWVANAVPAYLSFWAARIDNPSDLNKVRSLLGGLQHYCNDVGAFLYEPLGSPTQYKVCHLPELSMDRAINEFVQRVVSSQNT